MVHWSGTSFYQNLRANDSKQGSEIAKMQTPRDLELIYCMLFSDDGKQLFVGSANGEVQAWELANANQFKRKASLPPSMAW